MVPCVPRQGGLWSRVRRGERGRRGGQGGDGAGVVQSLVGGGVDLGFYPQGGRWGGGLWAEGGTGPDPVFMIIFVIFAGLLPVCYTAAALWGEGSPWVSHPAFLPPLGAIGWGEFGRCPCFAPAVWQPQ